MLDMGELNDHATGRYRNMHRWKNPKHNPFNTTATGRSLQLTF
jgi:hypothetical protein